MPLWRSSAYLEEKAGAIGKARAVLEQARLRNAKQDQLWLAAIRTELRSGNTKAADALMAKALQVSLHTTKLTEPNRKSGLEAKDSCVMNDASAVGGVKPARKPAKMLLA